MKTLRQDSIRREGSVLLITLFIGLGLGLILASYLLLIRSQYISVVRSQAWHSALTLAEAGVEEALAQLNSAPFTNAIPTGNGWVLVDGVYQLEESRALLDGHYGAAYLPTLSPTIYATGYASVPTLSATIERVVEARTALAPLFSVGAAVRGAIQLNGKRLVTDSFDSTSPYSSGPGGSYDPSETRPYGDIGSGAGFLNFASVNIQGSVILGAAATNLWESQYDVSGETRQDFNADFREVQPPYESLDRQPLPGSLGLTNYAYFLWGYNYQTSNLNGALFVTNDVEAVLYVTGDANIPLLVVAPGASLKLYVGGGNTTLGRVLVFGTATKFQYYGLPGNTNLTMIGYDRITGTIYAPNAKFRGGERSPGDSFIDFDLYGAIVVDSMDMHSDFKLHFDESLKAAPATSGLTRGFVITSWQELPPP
jgi:hypothetical protein